MKYLAIICAVALLAGPASALGLPSWLGGGDSAQEEPAGPPRPVVSVIVEDRGDEARWIPGLVASRDQVTMGFQTLGRMVSRPVDLGSMVEEGETIAELSTDDLAATTRAARAAFDAAEVQQRTAEATLSRTSALAKRNVSSNAQLEQAQQSAVAANAALEQARSELLQAEDSEGFATMTAPFAGVISAVYEEPGAVVSAGQQVLQLSAQDEKEVLIDLPASALVGLDRDAVFTVWHRNEPAAEEPAVLDRIDPVADSATRTRRLHLGLPQDSSFRLGALVRARFGSVDDPSLSLPAAAVLTVGDDSFVWSVHRDGDTAYVEQVPVTAAAPFQGRVSITSGLESGDEIVIRGVKSLTDGQAVGRRLNP
jgi:RND family efflux transporter MFP subunit